MKTKLLTLVFLFLGMIAQGQDKYYRDFFYKSNNKCNDYVIILIGGNEDANYSHFFLTEAYKSYQYYVNVKGCSPSRIRVLCQNGPRLNLDNDAAGTMDVQGSSDKMTIDKMFKDLSSKMTSNDILNLVVFAHGGYNTLSLQNFTFTPSYLNEKLALLKYKKANLFLLGCHSGSWIDDLKKSNHTIITCTSARNQGRMHAAGNVLTTQLYKALAGKVKLTINPNNWNSIIADKETVDADYNKDGSVSLEEAFVYAKDHEKHSRPGTDVLPLDEKAVPRYWSYDTPWRFCKTENWGVLTTNEDYYSNAVDTAMYLLVGNKVINKGVDVTFYSGKMIKLQKGFRVVKGAKFRTSHFDCEDEKRQNEAELRSGAIAEAEMEEEQDVINYVFYPNPSSTGLFNINLGETPATITVYDSYGKCVEVLNNVDGNVVVDLSGRAKGIYAANIETEKKNVVCRLIVR